MKLTNRRLLGRYTNPETNKPVNVHKARDVRRGIDWHFFVRSGKRVFIMEADFYAKWKRV